MHIEVVDKGILQIDNARITHRNFSGAQTPYNRKGDRNFSLVFDNEEVVDELRADGWNIKKKTSEEDDLFMFMKVMIKFNGRGPAVYLKSGETVTRLDEESVDILDEIDIASVDLDVRPYDWNVNGKTGRSAYLQSILVIQDIDRFAARYVD